MICSRSPAFIFIAVPKTGTSSVEQALSTYADQTLSTSWNKHVLAMKLQNEMPPELWASSLRFAFVRHPYDWMQSWYRYRQRDALRDPGHRHHHRYTGDRSFDEFVATFRDGDLMLTQSDFLVDTNGELLVDFVGRYESLQEDFDAVCARLGLPTITLPRVNESSRMNRSSMTMCDDSRRIIREYFSRDFALFDYRAD